MYLKGYLPSPHLGPCLFRRYPPPVFGGALVDYSAQFIPGIHIDIPGGENTFAVLTGYDRQRNVALLTFEAAGSGVWTGLPDTTDGQVGPEWASVEKVGEEMVAAGFCSAISASGPIATYGRLGIIQDEFPLFIRSGHVDAAVCQEMPGGPVWNGEGELVGMILNGVSILGESARYLSAAEIAEVIDDLRSGVQR